MSRPIDSAASKPADDNFDDSDSKDLEVGDQIFPLGQSGDSLDGANDIELGDWGEELNPVVSDDEGEGPIDDDPGMDSLGLESMLADENQDEESSGPEASLIGDQLPQSEPAYQELCDSTDDAEFRYGSGFSDAEIPWSPQPWCERRLARAFAPCYALQGRANVVLATGDSTSLLDTENVLTLAESPIQGRTSSAVLLDDRAEKTLVTTVTGQLLLWNRAKNTVKAQCAEDGRDLDCVACVCESTPGSAEVWSLLSNGNVYYRTIGAERFTHYGSREGYLAIASGSSSLAAITRDRRLVRLTTHSKETSDPIRLPEGNAGALSERTVLVVHKSFVLVGAREFGAWLSSDDGHSFSEIPGCQNMTAATFGTHGGRAFLWITLFRELEDRTELIAVECRTRRAHKLANFAVVADCAGPEDDPPERARVDGLYWDSVHQRLFAAGCFGLTCFEPHQSAQSPS